MRDNAEAESIEMMSPLSTNHLNPSGFPLYRNSFHNPTHHRFVMFRSKTWLEILVNYCIKPNFSSAKSSRKSIYIYIYPSPISLQKFMHAVSAFPSSNLHSPPGSFRLTALAPAPQPDTSQPQYHLPIYPRTPNLLIHRIRIQELMRARNSQE